MNFTEVQDVIQGVFTDFRVILCTIFVIAYLDLIAYIVNYQKKPKKVTKKKSKPVVQPAEKTENTETPAEAPAEEATAE